MEVLKFFIKNNLIRRFVIHIDLPVEIFKPYIRLFKTNHKIIVFINGIIQVHDIFVGII